MTSMEDKFCNGSISFSHSHIAIFSLVGFSKPAISFSWTNPNYSVDSTTVKYIVEIDSAGRNFSKAAQKIMDIAPQNEPLVIEAQVPPNYADRVKEKLLADIRFSAFAHSPQLVVEGKVISVSGDLLTDPANPQMSYYLARLEVTPEGMKTLGNRQMQAGMPAEVVIKTGSRSMLTYMLNPLLKRLAGSMKEE